MREITKIKHRRSKKRRDQVTNLQQPVQKRRRTTTQTQQYIRVIQQENTGEKRKEDTQNEYKETQKRTRLGNETSENKESTEKTEPTPPLRMKGKNWEEYTEERWKKYLLDREHEIQEEERTTRERRERANRLEKGWELFRLCRETIEKEGNKWEASKVRRMRQGGRRKRLQTCYNNYQRTGE